MKGHPMTTDLKPAFTPEELIGAAKASAFHLPPQEQEDAAQEFILAALQAQAHAQEGQAVRAYQWNSGLGGLKKHVRRAKRWASHEGKSIDAENGEGRKQEFAGREDNPLDSLIEKEAHENLSQTLSTLSTKERFLLKEHYNEGKTYQEIGKLLGISRERVRQILTQAIKTLRKEIA